MGRPERPIDAQAGPQAQFAAGLRALRREAGGPTYRQLARRAHFSASALSEAARGEVLPSLVVAMAYVEACGGDREEWERRWRAAATLIEQQESDPGENGSRRVEEGPDDPAPYLGLASYRPEDAEWFFGREQLVGELCARITRSRFLAVFGPSGSGKSSLLMAGLVPAIRTNAVGGAQRRRIVLLTPGDGLLPALTERLRAGCGGADGGPPSDPGDRSEPASAQQEGVAADQDAATVLLVLAGLPEGTEVVIVVDQFEEVFTQYGEDERRRFVDCLLAAGRSGRARVVLGVRADFYGRCAEHPGLVEALQDRQVLVGPPDARALRRMIVEPARRAQLQIEDGLVDMILAEAGSEPGALPLVSHVLRETWLRRRGGELKQDDYRQAGGLRGAVSRTAEDVYEAADDRQRAAMREVVLRLITPGEATEDTRRRARVSSLVAGESHLPADVIARLVDARLLCVDEDWVTIAHEALIGSWPRLRGWLDDDRDFLRDRHRLAEAAAEWQRHHRDDDFVFRGSRLAVWQDRTTDRLDPLERAFLDAGRAVARREAAGRRRRVRAAIVSLVTALTTVSALAVFGALQANRAGQERDRALSRELVTRARTQLQLDPRAALGSAAKAYRVQPSTEAEATAWQALADNHLRLMLSGDTGRPLADGGGGPATNAGPGGAGTPPAPVKGSGRVLGVAVSPDGHALAASRSDGTVRVWRWRDGIPAGERWGLPPASVPDPETSTLHGSVGEVWSPVFGPEGRWLAGAGYDGTVRLWDLARPQAPRVLTGHRGPVWRVASTVDGRRLASAGEDGTVRIWDTADGRPVTVLEPKAGSLQGVTFSPDGRRVAAAGRDATVRVWDLGSGGQPTVLSGPKGPIKALSFSPDGQRLAGASIDGAAYLWPSSGGFPLVLSGHEGTVEGLAFSHDGRLLATGGDDATVRVWNVLGDGTRPVVLRGHRRTVWSLAFTPADDRLASAGEEGTVGIWDPRVGGDPVVLAGHSGPAWTATYTHDAHHVISGGQDGTVRVWDPATRTVTTTLTQPGGQVNSVAASADGGRIAAGADDGTISVWTTGHENEPVRLRGHSEEVWSVAFSPDGRRLASGGTDGTVRVWDLSGQDEPLVRQADSRFVRSVAFAPDGRHVATAGADSTVKIWDLVGTSPPVTLTGHSGLVWSVAFSPDGQRIATGADDGTVRLWSRAEPTRPLLTLTGHQGFVWCVAFSPDGRWVASAGKDATARLWSVRDGQSLVFTGFGTTVENISFAPKGARLLTAHGDGTLRIWSPPTEVSMRQVLPGHEEGDLDGRVRADMTTSL